MKGRYIIRRNIISKVVPLLLTVCCAAAIFIFSMQNGNQSEKLSTGFLTRILAFLRGVSISDITYEDIKKYSFLIRKIAHFSVFFTLGIFSYWSAWALLKKRYIFTSFVFCVLYACSDELHQFFSEGRGPAVRDVCIDSTGALAGILLMALLLYCLNKFFNKRAVTSKNDFSFD